MWSLRKAGNASSDVCVCGLNRVHNSVNAGAMRTATVPGSISKQ